VARGRRKRKVKTQRESAAKPELLTIKELAAYLHAHRMTIYRLLSKGQLPGFRVGHIWRFRREEVDRWMRRKSEE
jgi:excisionase family DNA binding protein